MTYIEGETLSAAWRTMSQETRLDIAHQLGRLLKIMRALPPPPNFIGAFQLDELRDYQHNDVFVRPACRNEEGLDEYLTEDYTIPACVKRRFLKGIGTSHKFVFSHGDLAPRNIMVHDNHIVALIDWEAAGWYPEYWEYVKFMHIAGRDTEWRRLVDVIFPENYDNESLLYTGLLHYQDSFGSSKSLI
ncbi:Protein kinase-like domain protein [Cordyceps fumosorosea ARSEF 2679]|uniref:non-specific serine/threonine protein kinase n=1 Tax=Cordyceps fumosorosea (strain ARSEF 2679) TaxID=1081104 RepID=A0A167V4D2_CORFA|nr:Protein kinase-like domain protein [Cordyceps fumosorosea ARSEF 2679]OAA62213.1 Protein kinase-like domain protein [Cordyceps fumosorosea ARSEF 2679]